MRVVPVSSLLLLLVACGPQPTPTPPAAPVIHSAVTNAQLVPASGPNGEPLVQYTNHRWQTKHSGFDAQGQLKGYTEAGTFTWGWLEDALVGNPYSFQIRVTANLANGGLTVVDDKGATLAAVKARTNSPHDCHTKTGQVIPDSQCFDYPGTPGYLAPASVPTASGVYTVMLETICKDPGQQDGPITPLRYDYRRFDRQPRCAASQTVDTTVLLTISPSRQTVPNPGTPVRYELVASNAAGQARTPFLIEYVQPQPTQPPFPSFLYLGYSRGSSAPSGGVAYDVTGSTGSPLPCPALAGGEEVEFTFTMTCSGQPVAGYRVGSGCTRAEARAEVLRIYALEIAGGCIIGQ
jgi:hypothetical protein